MEGQRQGIWSPVRVEEPGRGASMACVQGLSQNCLSNVLPPYPKGMQWRKENPYRLEGR